MGKGANGLSDRRRCVPQWTQFAASLRGRGDAICHHEGRAFVPHAGSRFQGAFRSVARFCSDDCLREHRRTVHGIVS